MTQRFLSSSSNSRLAQQHERGVESRRDSRCFAADQLTESVYIFPNPSSAPPSPCQTSSLSELSQDMATLGSDTPNDLDEWEWPEGSAMDESVDYLRDQEAILTRATARPTGRETQGNRQARIPLRSHPLQDHLTRSSPRRLHRISTNISPAYAQSFHTLSTTSSSVPSTRWPVHLKLLPNHARIHVPFLSFFLSFLSVDESTVHLLSRMPQHSILFPGDAIMSEPCLTTIDPQILGTNDTGRDAFGALLEFDEELSVYARLKEGHTVACDYLNGRLVEFPFKQFSSLWGFVHGFVQKSGKKPSGERENYVD